MRTRRRVRLRSPLPQACPRARLRTRVRARQASGRAIAFDRSQKTLPYPLVYAPTSRACDRFYLVGSSFSRSRAESLRIWTPSSATLGPIVETFQRCYSREGPVTPRGRTILNRISTTLAATALIVAVLGITPLGQAAANAVRVAVFAQNAGKVGNIKASRTPVPGQLLPLDAKGRFPASVFPQGVAGPPGERGERGPQGAQGSSPARPGRRELESRTCARSSSAPIRPTRPRTACSSATR